MTVLVLSCLLATIGLILDVLMLMMFLRAVTSWFPGTSETPFGEFLFTVTEWVITPVRALFDAFNLNAPMIIDIPFFVTFIILSVVSSFI